MTVYRSRDEKQEFPTVRISDFRYEVFQEDLRITFRVMIKKQTMKKFEYVSTSISDLAALVAELIQATTVIQGNQLFGFCHFIGCINVTHIYQT
eukprot:m.41160 g.41160  ORF g.41160 m.41160 type:complete len:94 (+) comp33092_c0_seq7:350-631(+)